MDKSQDSKQENEINQQILAAKAQLIILKDTLKEAKSLLAENEAKLRVNELKIGYYLSLGMVLPKGFQL